jgi:hypothetical protein
MPNVTGWIDMKFLDNGVTRIVILAGPWAFKIARFNYSWPNFLRGLLGNMQERDFWTTKWPELCPVLWASWGGFLNIQKRARPLTDDEWEVFDFDGFADPRDWHEERIVKGRYPEGNYVPVENKRCSFGVIDNQIVAVDYGS